MSAYVHDRAHVLAIVRTALQGPSDPHAVSPDSVWHGPRWSVLTDAALDEMSWQEAGRTYRTLDHLNAEDVARILYDENVASVRYRYDDADASGMVPPMEPFVISAIIRARRLSVRDALCALSSLEYQSCEHPEWNSSEARRFCEAFRRSLCSFIERGSDCWSIHDEVSA